MQDWPPSAGETKGGLEGAFWTAVQSEKGLARPLGSLWATVSCQKSLASSRTRLALVVGWKHPGGSVASMRTWSLVSGSSIWSPSSAVLSAVGGQPGTFSWPHSPTQSTPSDMQTYLSTQMGGVSLPWFPWAFLLHGQSLPMMSGINTCLSQLWWEISTLPQWPVWMNFSCPQLYLSH